jgi:hypothetical protein
MYRSTLSDPESRISSAILADVPLDLLDPHVVQHEPEDLPVQLPLLLDLDGGDPDALVEGLAPDVPLVLPYVGVMGEVADDGSNFSSVEDG